MSSRVSAVNLRRHSPFVINLTARTLLCVCAVQNASAQAALQAAQSMTGGDTQGGPNTVLRVIIEHMVYPVTLDVLQQVRTH